MDKMLVGGIGLTVVGVLIIAMAAAIYILRNKSEDKTSVGRENFKMFLLMLVPGIASTVIGIILLIKR